MKTTKKFSLLMACILAVGVCASCGKNDSVNESSKKTETLVWYVPGDKQSDIGSVMAEANKIIEEKIQANLDLQFIDISSFNQRMQMAMASGDNYDLCFTGYLNKYTTAVYNEALEPLTELIKTQAPGLEAAVPDYVWEDAKINDEIYAVPNQQVEFYQYSLMVRKDLADKYNLDPDSIKEVQDMEPFLAQVKANEPDVYPFRANYQLQMFWKNTLEEVSPGYCIRKDKPTEIVILRDQPEYQTGLETLRSWYEKGYIRENVLSAGDDTTELKAGKFAVWDGTWKPGQEAQNLAMYGREYVCVKIGEPYMINGNSRTTMIGINVNSKHKEKAIKLIEMLNTDKELYNLLCFGIEGKHYTLDSENKVNYIEDSGYKPNASWKFGNQFNAYNIVGEKTGIWEETVKLNNECEKSPILGFYFDTSKSSNIISSLSAITGEYNGMQKGAVDYKATWDTMVSRIKAAGEDTLVADMQAQLDEFFEKK